MILTVDEIKKASIGELLNEYAMNQYVMLKPEVRNDNDAWRKHADYYANIRNEIISRCGNK